ncbi:MAG: flagellar basal body P-ring protein FlgI, partial [Planctomycetes bacterium]|nr:flagellar basal body P-ring protein FlgI [Planctomycetota bacterium]
MRVRIMILIIFFLLLSLPAQAERVSVLATIKGTSPLKISGTGIVEGLNGTGDKAVASRKALKTLLAKENINVAMSDIDGQNVAVVSVSAEIPAFTRPGTMIDVTVASLFDAENLQNGILKLTHLRVEGSGETYAVASGRVNIGGEDAANQFPTTANITGGAQVVRAHEVDFLSDRSTFELLLKEPSFATSQAIAHAINSTSGTNPRLDRYLEEAGFEAFDKPVPGFAQALNAGTVIVQIPDYYMMD